jgi:regulator of RNase E activity RraA
MLDEATKTLCEGIGRLRTAIVGDVLREMGFPHQILHTSISGLVRGMKLIGPAFTIRGEPFMGAPPKLAPGTRQAKYEMFHTIYRGCVLVYATGGYEEAAAWGDNINISARHKGCAGVVVDGGVRDAEPIIEAGMPVFGRFITPTSSAPRFGITDYQTPVTMTGQTTRHVAVNPGDLILGDFDGVLVIPRAAAPAMLEAAIELARIEEIQFAELARGGDRQTVYEGYSRFGHIKKWTHG